MALAAAIEPFASLALPSYAMAAGMTTTNFPVAALGPLVGGSCVWAASYCANIDRAFCTIDVLALALPVFVAAVVPQPGSIPARARIAIATAGRLLTFGLTICLRPPSGLDI
jgi:hypothetical protein